MWIPAILARSFAAYTALQRHREGQKAALLQRKTLVRIVKQAADTRFGRDHDFASVSCYEDFKRRAPIRDYEALSPYFNRVVKGQSDVLWPGRPLYLSKTSGTTSGAKYIPITSDSIHNHIESMRIALFHYIHRTGNASFLNAKWIFLSGSPALEKIGKTPVGRLSGIVNHHVPAFLRANQRPSYETNCMEDWEQKIEAIVSETVNTKMGLVSGIPPWVQMYLDRVAARAGKPIREVFPHLSLLVYGGVNFAPYKDRLLDTIGKPVDTLELYPASEGFIAYQDRGPEEGLCLLANSGIFFEFVPVDTYFDEHPRRLCLEQVETDKNYALVLNSNAGLWGYSLGDTVKFVDLAPPRILFTGRVAHFTSAFGEHVIGHEVEKALRQTLAHFSDVRVVEFTVAPQIAPSEGLPHHQWWIEFARPPEDMAAFSAYLDARLCDLNIYYKDLICGGILRPLVVTPLRRNAFVEYMKARGKLGGQHKAPRLSNDRTIVESMASFVLTDAV